MDMPLLSVDKNESAAVRYVDKNGRWYRLSSSPGEYLGTCGLFKFFMGWIHYGQYSLEVDYSRRLVIFGNDYYSSRFKSIVESFVSF